MTSALTRLAVTFRCPFGLVHISEGVDQLDLMHCERENLRPDQVTALKPGDYMAETSAPTCITCVVLEHWRIR